ncbi:hypothetical protein BS17DRAFT_836169 [Gyrodon lividus]|nr:hypothetical protein BS17DRAFT_836169 [Gyrodon lividus]
MSSGRRGIVQELNILWSGARLMSPPALGYLHTHLKMQKKRVRKRSRLVNPRPSCCYLLSLLFSYMTKEYHGIAQRNPAIVIPVVQHCLLSLQRKYMEMNQDIWQTDAGRTYEDLTSGDGMKNIIDSIVKEFLWWPGLHGWWRTNPAYNMAFTNADKGQNFAGTELAIFMKPHINLILNLSHQLLHLHPL